MDHEAKTVLKRLKIGMSMPQMIQTLAAGNPGGLAVLVRMTKELKTVVCIASFIVMDQKDLVGEKIWEAWNDKAGQDMETFINDLTGGFVQ